MTLRLLVEQDLELLSLKGGCTGWSESTFVKIFHYWKVHVAAHMGNSIAPKRVKQFVCWKHKRLSLILKYLIQGEKMT